MSFFSRLFGKRVSVKKHNSGYISIAGDAFRLEQGPRKISLRFEDGESPTETAEKMIQRMKENGVGPGYLRDRRDMYGAPIAAGKKLHFYQWKRPFIWKFYESRGGVFVQIDEADLSESDAIKWALTKI